MNRNQITLAGLLVLQVALILLVRSPFSAGSLSAESHPLLPMLEALTPTQIELSGTEDRLVRLVKQDDGWRIENLDGFPADGDRIDELIDNLRSLKVGRPVVTSKRYHATFKVAEDDNEGRVKLWDNPAKDPAVELIVGSSSNYRAVNVRLAGDSDVYEVRDLASYDVRADPAAWIEKDLVDVPAAQIVGLTLSNGNGEIELTREDDSWHAAGTTRPLKSTEVDSLLRAAGSIQLSKPAGRKDAAAQGFTDPAATVTLRYRPPGAAGDEGAESAGGDENAAVQEVVVTIGSKPDEKSVERYISRSDFDFTGLVWDSTIKTLLERKLDDLIGDDDDG